jgi:DNA-binding CsgD family transcriptional regulator
MQNTPVPIPIPLQKVPEMWGSFKSQSNIDSGTEQAWKEKARFLDAVSLQNNVVVFVFNPHTNRYLYMSDKLKVLSGIDPLSYTGENGAEFAYSRAHPDQFESMVQMNQFAVKCISGFAAKDYKDLLICLSFLYKNGNDEYVQVLQRSIALEVGEAGMPSLFISFGHYVGHLKKPGSLDLVFSTPNNIIMYDYNFEQKCIDGPKTFSEQEKKIVVMLAQGDDTKTIAQKLFISPHTVDTHRRNLIKKTNSVDTTGVVAIAKLINLI